MAKENQEPDSEEERPVVVWGLWGETPLFMLKREADDWGDLWEGLDSSKTVGDLRKHFHERDPVFEYVWEEAWMAPETWTPEVAALYETEGDFVVADIPDSYPFDSKTYCERHYDFRGSIGAFELYWFPDPEVRARCADSGGSMTGGELETFRPGTQDEVIACLESHGYMVVHDEVAIGRAVGW